MGKKEEDKGWRGRGVERKEDEVWRGKKKTRGGEERRRRGVERKEEEEVWSTNPVAGRFAGALLALLDGQAQPLLHDLQLHVVLLLDHQHEACTWHDTRDTTSYVSHHTYYISHVEQRAQGFIIPL